MLKEMFEMTSANATAGSRGLPGTAELTRVATAAAHRIIKAMEEDIAEWRPRIQASATDARELDAILDEFKPFADIEEDSLLRHLDDDTVEGMLKSQQSKRSRTKSKTMTLDNYITLLTAAIAEDILRELYNKPKNATVGSRSSSLDYTGAQLEALAADQEALRREIRNVQSKKSIMKSKAGFSESDERWLQLLKAEQQLKDLRVSTRMDATKQALKAMLTGVDIQKLKVADAHELLEAIARLVEDDEEYAEEATEE